jgi:hypothetical protein
MALLQLRQPELSEETRRQRRRTITDADSRMRHPTTQPVQDRQPVTLNLDTCPLRKVELLKRKPKKLMLIGAKLVIRLDRRPQPTRRRTQMRRALTHRKSRQTSSFVGEHVEWAAGSAARFSRD